MDRRILRSRLHPALKHAAYSTTTLLPGESRKAFDKLHRDLVKDLKPTGALEDGIVFDIARLTWRKQNLATLRKAEIARELNDKIVDRNIHAEFSKWDRDQNIETVAGDVENKEDGKDGRDDNLSESKQFARALQEQRRRELGTACGLVEIGDAVTVERLLVDLELERRLDSQIDRCLKRLYLLWGMRTVSRVPPS